MSIVKRNNSRPSSVSFFDDFLSRDLFDGPGWTNEGSSIPRVNIVESADDFMVEMAAPGMRKSDFQLELDNDMLYIQAQLPDQPDSDQKRYTRREFNFESFRRSFYLPNTVEVDNIKAKYQDGILRLLIPKKEEARKKPVKTISIS